MPNALQIDVMFKGQQLNSKTFQRNRIVIGRDPECDLKLENVGVSRHHALVELMQQGYVLRDLGSSNGTFVDERAIEAWSVEDGGKARITKFELVFRLVDAVADSGSQTTEGVPGFGEQNTMSVSDEPPRKTRRSA